jgi:hypothetical protein
MFFVAQRRRKLASHKVAGYFVIASRPERTVEMVCFSDVLSGHVSNTVIPATLWLANILMSLRDRRGLYRATFLSTGSGHFSVSAACHSAASARRRPVASSNTGLESPVNPQAGKPALRIKWNRSGEAIFKMLWQAAMELFWCFNRLTFKLRI